MTETITRGLIVLGILAYPSSLISLMLLARHKIKKGRERLND